MTSNEIALYYENGTLGSFSTTLMNLIAKADVVNKQKLEQVFPEYVEAYYLWYNGTYNKG